MNKVILPDGNTIIMSEAVFDQDPNFFMRFLVGSLVIGRLTNNEGNRLELIFDRKSITDILVKDQYTWQDYQNVLEWCI
jgi:hypothetical protein